MCTLLEYYNDIAKYWLLMEVLDCSRTCYIIQYDSRDRKGVGMDITQKPVSLFPDNDEAVLVR